MASCLGLLMPALVPSADDSVAAKEVLVLKLPRSGGSTAAPGLHSKPPVAASVKSNGGRSVDPRLTEDSLNLEAGKIIERAAPGAEAAEAERIIELATDVRLTLHGGPVTASADRAIVTVRYKAASRTTIESVTIELWGGVQGSFDGIDVSGNRLTLGFRPSVQSAATKPLPTHWIVTGRARLRGNDFSAKADRIQMEREDDEAQQTLLVKLEGNAALKYAGTSWMQGARIELRPYRNSLRMVGAQPMRE